MLFLQSKTIQMHLMLLRRYCETTWMKQQKPDDFMQICTQNIRHEKTSCGLESVHNLLMLCFASLAGRPSLSVCRMQQLRPPPQLLLGNVAHGIYPSLASCLGVIPLLWEGVIELPITGLHVFLCLEVRSIKIYAKTTCMLHHMLSLPVAILKAMGSKMNQVEIFLT